MVKALIASLKGQFKALERAGIEKKCGLKVKRKNAA
jgi:hypothetical protein